MINVQGLTQAKAIELENLTNHNDITLLTETQQKFVKVRYGKDTNTVEQMRDMKEKKGGGLTILTKNKNIKMKKIDTKQKDILIVEVEYGTDNFTLVLVYLSVSDHILNDKIIKEIKEKITKNNYGKYIILGDLNGHIGLVGTQKLNTNGKKILKLVEDLELNILNLDPRCEGEATWGRGEQSSTIDFILTNNNMTDKFERMHIDEKQEIYDLSDHNLITAHFKTSKYQKKNEEIKLETFEYYKMDEERTEKYLQHLEEKIKNEEEKPNIHKLENMIIESANETLKKTIHTRTRQSKENKNEEKQIFINNNILEEIEKRKYINRRKRNAKTKQESEYYKERYERKKEQIKALIKETLTKKDKKDTQEIKNDKSNKKIWHKIDKLRGKTKTKDTETKIYEKIAINNEIKHTKEQTQDKKEKETNRR